MKKEITLCLYGMLVLAVSSASVGCAMPADPADDSPASSEESQPVTGCPYQTLQARVQPDIQTEWNQFQTIPLGHSIRMAGFGDARAVIDSSGSISLVLVGPSGTQTFANDTTIQLPAGAYRLTARCGNAPSEIARIVVQGPDCPYSSLQVRVQPNLTTPWTQFLVINRGQQFRVGALFNGEAVLAPSGVVLTVAAPNGVSTSPANGTFVTAPVSGVYSVTGTCGTMPPQSAAVIAQ